MSFISTKRLSSIQYCTMAFCQKRCTKITNPHHQTLTPLCVLGIGTCTSISTFVRSHFTCSSLSHIIIILSLPQSKACSLLIKTCIRWYFKSRHLYWYQDSKSWFGASLISTMVWDLTGGADTLQSVDLSIENWQPQMWWFLQQTLSSCDEQPHVKNKNRKILVHHCCPLGWHSYWHLVNTPCDGKRCQIRL